MALLPAVLPETECKRLNKTVPLATLEKINGKKSSDGSTLGSWRMELGESEGPEHRMGSQAWLPLTHCVTFCKAPLWLILPSTAGTEESMQNSACCQRWELVSNKPVRTLGAVASHLSALCRSAEARAACSHPWRSYFGVDCVFTLK